MIYEQHSYRRNHYWSLTANLRFHNLELFLSDWIRNFTALILKSSYTVMLIIAPIARGCCFTYQFDGWTEECLFWCILDIRYFLTLQILVATQVSSNRDVNYRLYFLFNSNTLLKNTAQVVMLQPWLKSRNRVPMLVCI